VISPPLPSKKKGGRRSLLEPNKKKSYILPLSGKRKRRGIELVPLRNSSRLVTPGEKNGLGLEGGRKKREGGPNRPVTFHGQIEKKRRREKEAGKAYVSSLRKKRSLRRRCLHSN